MIRHMVSTLEALVIHLVYKRYILSHKMRRVKNKHAQSLQINNVLTRIMLSLPSVIVREWVEAIVFFCCQEYPRYLSLFYWTNRLLWTVWHYYRISIISVNMSDSAKTIDFKTSWASSYSDQVYLSDSNDRHLGKIGESFYFPWQQESTSAYMGYRHWCYSTSGYWHWCNGVIENSPYHFSIVFTVGYAISSFIS